MANGISSAASSRALTTARASVQVAKPESARLPAGGGAALPSGGKGLPVQASNSAEISRAVSQINQIVQSVQRDLSFNVDEDSGRTVIRVVDSESGELIRQIPSEEVLAIVTHLRDYQASTASQGEIGQGLLFSDST